MRFQGRASQQRTATASPAPPGGAARAATAVPGGPPGGRRLTPAAAALVVFALPAVLALPGAASAAPSATTFVHSANSGELKGGRLTLRGVRRNVTWVDHAGRSGVVSVAALHRRLFGRLAPPGWPGSNTRLPAPTALLYVGQRPRRVAGLRLSQPRYSPARRTLSYRVTRLTGAATRAVRAGTDAAGHAAQQSVPSQFGPASLSIAALGSPDDVFHCTTTVENDTDYTIEATASGLWPNDTWNPGIPVNYLSLPDSPSDTLVYGSDGGFMRGCGNSSVWTIVDGPPGVRGVTFSFYTTIPYNSSGVPPLQPPGTCTPSAPNFKCVFDQGGLNYWYLQAAG
jgi:hypothetical protein